MKKTAFLPLLGLLALAVLVYFSHFTKEHYQRTVTTYQVPDVTLINQNSEPVKLASYLETDKPLMLEFIFTSCTTLCPTLSVKYSNFQKKFAPHTEQIRLVSISVDPENDTPEVIRAYLKHYQAQPGWDFLTGNPEDINRVMAAFDIKPSDMITLDASLLLRSPKTRQWVRVDGRLNGDDFLREYELLSK